MTLLVIVHSIAPVNLRSSYFFLILGWRLERGSLEQVKIHGHYPVRVSFKLGGANPRHTVAKLNN